MFEPSTRSLIEKPIKKPKLANKKGLSRQELLEVSQNISRYYAPKVSLSTQKLVLLAIDPKHLYAYWNLVENQPDTLSQNLSNSEWVLRVYKEQQSFPTKIIEKPIAEIQITALQSGQEIRLPVVKKEMIFSATISKVVEENGFNLLIKSNITLPLYGKEIQPDTENTASENTESFHESLFPQTYFYANTSRSGKGKIKVI